MESRVHCHYVSLPLLLFGWKHKFELALLIVDHFSMKKETNPMYFVCTAIFEGPVDFDFLDALSFLLLAGRQPFMEACAGPVLRGGEGRDGPPWRRLCYMQRPTLHV